MDPAENWVHGSREEEMDVEGQLVLYGKKKKKKFLCFVIDLKMLYELAL